MSAMQLCTPYRLGMRTKKRKQTPEEKSFKELCEKHNVHLDSPKRRRLADNCVPIARKARPSLVELLGDEFAGSFLFQGVGFEHIQQIVKDYLGLADAILFEFTSVIDKRLTWMLDTHRVRFTQWAAARTDEQQIEQSRKFQCVKHMDVLGKMMETQCRTHFEYADWRMADSFRQAVHSDQVKSLNAVWTKHLSYWAEQGWRMVPSNHPKTATCLSKCVLFTIRYDRRFMFHGLMQLQPKLEPLRQWLKCAIRWGRTLFVRELVQTYFWKDRSDLVRYARTNDMLEELKHLGFPLQPSLVLNAIQRKDHDRTLWLLQNGVREKTDRTGSYLKKAIDVGDCKTIELLYLTGHRCPPEMMARALLRGDCSVVSALYRWFYFDKTGAFQNDIYHDQFLRDFIHKLQVPETESAFFGVLLWVESHWWYRDLNTELLFSWTIEHGAVDEFRLLYRKGYRSFLSDHMDAAILLDDCTIMKILLDEGVKPTQHGMQSLKNKRTMRHRFTELMSHPVCRNIRIQPLLNDLPETTINKLMTRNIPTSPGEYSRPTPMVTVDYDD